MLMSGILYKSTADDAADSKGPVWTAHFGTLRGHILYLNPGTKEDEEHITEIPVEDSTVSSPDSAKGPKRYCIDLVVSEGDAYHFSVKTKEDHENWLQSLAAAAVPETWPGGQDLGLRPHPLLYSIWASQHTDVALSVGNIFEGFPVVDDKASLIDYEALEDLVPSPFYKLPPLDSVPTWQTRGLLLQKLRQCTIIFDGVDPSRFQEDREIKSKTLLEIANCFDTDLKVLFRDERVAEDVMTMIKLNIFRTLPVPTEQIGYTEIEEPVPSDPQWSHLSIVYNILLRFVSETEIDFSLKKRLIDASFIRQLLQLFDTQDPVERDFLKTITHRIYSLITHRRALIRRLICNTFCDFVYENQNKRGIAELLDILASIITGFAVPIKAEHRNMLVRALLPLHKSPAVMSYHSQLSYCMAIYASKDHTCSEVIISHLIKYWPVGSATLEILFLQELQEIMEYAHDDDMANFCEPLSHRMAQCIGSMHFQVAESTILLWQGNRFSALMLESDTFRPTVFRILFPVLYKNHRDHWHESLRYLSLSLLHQYMEVDRELFEQVRDEYFEENPSEEPISLMEFPDFPPLEAHVVHDLLEEEDIHEEAPVDNLTPTETSVRSDAHTISVSPEQRPFVEKFEELTLVHDPEQTSQTKASAIHSQ